MTSLFKRGDHVVTVKNSHLGPREGTHHIVNARSAESGNVRVEGWSTWLSPDIFALVEPEVAIELDPETFDDLMGQLENPKPIPESIIQARDEMFAELGKPMFEWDKLKAQLDAVRALHQSGDFRCRECDVPRPCPTERIILGIRDTKDD